MSPSCFLQAASFVAPARVEEAARGWLAHAEPGFADAGQQMLRVADALGMATDLTLFTVSSSGATAFDRLARRRCGMGADEAAALDALRRAQFRLLRVEAPSNDGMARLRDLVTDEVLPVLDGSIGAEAAGVALVARLAPVSTCRSAGRRRLMRTGLQSPAASSAPAHEGCCRTAVVRPRSRSAPAPGYSLNM